MVNADDNITKSSAYSALFVAFRHGWSPSPLLVAWPTIAKQRFRLHLIFILHSGLKPPDGVLFF